MARYMLDTDTCSYIMKRSSEAVIERLRAYRILPSSHVVPRLAEQREVESGPLIHLALRPRTATVAVNDALDGRQPDASAIKFGLPVKPLERTK